MLKQIKKFTTNALAFELVDTFTEEDAKQIAQLFEEKLSLGYKHVNLLIQVKDMSIIEDTKLKAFFNSELWGMKHFKELGRCAVVSHSEFIKTAVTVENKILHLFNSALEEKYFDHSQLEEALEFINSDN